LPCNRCYCRFFRGSHSSNYICSWCVSEWFDPSLLHSVWFASTQSFCPELFKRYRKYGVAVFMCEHPGVKDYIELVVKSCREWLNKVKSMRLYDRIFNRIFWFRVRSRSLSSNSVTNSF
jgi:hypothetical protein